MGKDIFLSYAEEDSAHAEKFRQWLSDSLNIECFMARRNIKPGNAWRDEINLALRDCKIGVVIVTTRSYQREWVNFEIGALLSHEIPIFPIQLKEPDDHLTKVRMVTLENIQTYAWSASTAATLAAAIYEKLVKQGITTNFTPQPVEFCIEEMDFGPQTEEEFIKELYESRPLRNSPSLRKRFSDGERLLSHVLIDPLIKEYCEALDEAVKGKGTIPLTTRDRMKVAERMIRQATEQVQAISFVQNDPWLFDDDDSDEDSYLAENNKAGNRLKEKRRVRRLIVLPEDKKPDALELSMINVLKRMNQNQIDLRWISRGRAESILAEREQPMVENLLIVDGRWMTESRGKGHAGCYSVSEERITNFSNRFDRLWKKAAKFDASILPPHNP